MNIVENILLMCSEQGVNLSLNDEGALEVLFDDMPSDELVSQLKAHKPDLIEYLTEHQATADLTPLKALGESQGPLSFGQKRLWFIEQLEDNSAHYNIPLALELKGTLRKEALLHALNQIIARHQVLRTQYEVGGGIQVVKDDVEASLNDTSLAEAMASLGHDHANMTEQDALNVLMHQEQLKPFNLETDLMLRNQLVEVSPSHHVLLLTAHHIACDGWSLGILVQELTQLYTDYVEQKASDLPELPLQYLDYAFWQDHNRDSFERQLGFWTQHLAQAPATHSLHTDFIRPANQSFAGDNVSVQLGAAQKSALNALCQRLEVTPFMLCYSAFALLIAKLSQEDDVVIGTPIANRTHSSIEPLIGYFANTLALRSTLTGNESGTESGNENEPFESFVLRNKDMILNVFQNQSVPFEMVVDRVQPERNLAYSPLFQIMFSFHSHGNNDLALPGLQLQDITPKAKTVKTDIELAITEDDTGYVLDWNFSTALFSRSTIARLAACFEQVLQQVIAKPNLGLKQVSIVPQNDQALLDKWTAIQGLTQGQTHAETQSETKADSEATVHGLVEAMANVLGERIALVAGDVELSYQELDAKANRVAHYLLQQGIQASENSLERENSPERKDSPEPKKSCPSATPIVGVNMARTEHLIISLLGILKAGAAYLPLEASYPQARLDYMLEDSGAKVVLTQAIVDQILNDSDESAASSAGLPTVNASQLAYVIYTSGSTGKPKGVKVSHSNVVHFLNAMQPQLQTDVKADEQPTWLAVTGIAFDISVLELFGTLANGFKVVLYAGEPQVNEAAHSHTHTHTHTHTHAQAHTHINSQAANEDANGAPVNDHNGAGKKPVDFSLFYFAAGGKTADESAYHLLIEGAKFADENGFAAVWTPERHFDEFGGIYPAPAITNAALSTITKHIHLRAGSCVLPLNNPVNMAEQWSVIDNLSQGRTGIAFASGWHADDFVLAPQNFQSRHDVMYQGIDTFNKLWAGESINLINGKGNDTEVKLFPRPVQARMPQWLTIAGDPNAFIKAGEKGLFVLTHMLRQSVGELENNINAYREAWQAAGHQGEGKVSLMIHTFVGDSTESALETVYEPFSQYLVTALDLSGKGKADAGLGVDHDEIVNAAFGRYSKTAALFGDVEQCANQAQVLVNAGVDEIGCLIDFGVANDMVLQSLPKIKAVMDKLSGTQFGAGISSEASLSANAHNTSLAMQSESVAALIQKHGVTHMQCTPSFVQMHMLHPTDSEGNADRDSAENEGSSDANRANNTGNVLAQLTHLFVGGEAMPLSLAEHFAGFPLTVHNMYGPTEATVWASTHVLEKADSPRIVPIGQPLPGYGIHILDKHLNPQPIGVPGELHIAGKGVAQGYLNRDALSAEKFIDVDGVQLYKTGDKARWNENGVLEFHGRIDSQIKLRGHRIETDEIAVQISQIAGVENAVVVLDVLPAGARLAAYVQRHSQNSAQVNDQAHDENQTLDDNALIAHIKRELNSALPQYMVPTAFMVLDALPLTLNGKINKAALPKIDAAKQVSEFIAPSSDTEKALANLWATLLAMDEAKISATANFFDLGGHSLLLTKMIGELKTLFNVELGIRDVFENASIENLANFINAQAQHQQDHALLDQATTVDADQTEEFVL